MKLDNKMMHFLSFPDFDVQNFEFSEKNLFLKIMIEGACLLINNEFKLLSSGLLVFFEWISITVSSYNPIQNLWSTINMEPLKDICDIKFSCETVFLYGFSASSNNWLEIKINTPKMYADFLDDNVS